MRAHVHERLGHTPRRHGPGGQRRGLAGAAGIRHRRDPPWATPGGALRGVYLAADAVKPSLAARAGIGFT
ncbi:hypothetical protein GCM10022284_68010 [Streptomyces hundungensis]